MNLSPIVQCLYWSSPILLAPLLCLMLWKRFYRVRPLFFTYVIYEILSISLVLLLRPHYTLYFYVLWYISWAEDILSLLVIREIYHAELEGYRTLQALGSKLFYAGTVVLLAASVVIAKFLPGLDPGLSRRISALLVIQRSMLLLQMGLLLLLLVLSLTLALPWRGFAKGIALGLGLANALQGIPQTLYSAHLLPRGLFELCYACAFPSGVIVWLVFGARALLASGAEPAVDAQTLEKLRHSLTLPPER